MKFILTQLFTKYLNKELYSYTFNYIYIKLMLKYGVNDQIRVKNYIK